MSRRGLEAKPAWRDVPAPVRAEAERVLGARVVRAERVYGGYAPSATLRMRLADGRRAFFKGVNAGSNEYMRHALAQEERVYRELGAVIARWAPAFYGALRHEDWHVLLLEDLGPANVPPWSEAKARKATASLAAFHRSTLDRELPEWLPREEGWAPFAALWRRVAEEGAIDGAASLAGLRAGEAREWLSAHLAVLRVASERLPAASPPFALLHVDVRSDNMLLHGSLLRLVDWPNACLGPVEFDAAAFIQSVPAEGGPSCEWLLAAYEAHLPLRPHVLDASVAAIAGYFVHRAWQPPLPGLPRLRQIQRRQLKAVLPWAARRLDLPEPTWLEAVAD